MKTFRKAIAIMLSLVFVLSLVSVNVMAEDQGAVKLSFSNPISVRNNSTTGIRDYSVGLRVGDVTDQYKGFLQLDFSGYEYLLRDEASKLSVTLGAGARVGGTTLYLYDLGLYVMDDFNDAYADHYVPYSVDGEVTSGMSWGEFDTYVDPLTTIAGVEPFIVRNETTRLNSYTSDGNKQVILNALDASTDDSVVTLQYIAPVDVSGGKLGLIHSPNSSYVMIKGAENADAQAYVNGVKDMISWDSISNEGIKNVTEALTLPQKYLGVNITWTSSDTNALNPQTGAVTGNPDENTYVTLTANFSYTTYEGATVTAEKVFNLRIPKEFYDYSSGTGTFYDGSGNFISHSGSDSTHTPSYQKIGGIRGKAEDDLCYEIKDASGNRRYNVPEISPDDPTKIDIIEFDVCVPEGCYGFSTFIKLYHNINDSSKGGTSLSEFVFKDDGIWHSRFNSHLVKYDGTKWHHIAIVSPGIISSDENGYVFDKTLRIFVDGVEAYTIDAPSEYVAPFGINYCQLNGLCPLEYYDSTTKTWSAVAGYIDNLKFTNDSLDDIISYNTKSSVETSYEIDEAAGVISVISNNTTVADVINSLTIDEDATARIYDSSWNLMSDDAEATDSSTLVVADKNGTTSERTYAYYDIRVIEEDTVDFDVSVTKDKDGNVDGAVKLYNNTASAKTYDVYLVVYNSSEAVTVLDPVTLSAESGYSAEVEIADVAFEKGNIVKLLVWEKGSTTPAIKSVEYK